MFDHFFKNASYQNHPLRIITEFLEQEQKQEEAGNYKDLRFVGYALDITYENITIITSDPFKLAVGGVPRNSLLVMMPSNYQELPPHFTLLRVLESAPTPLSKEVQQTYFELQKRSMPELDVFTQSELQWGALKTEILGMFYPNPVEEDEDEIEFSNDLNNFVSAHKYKIYSPNSKLLDLIINCLVPVDGQFVIGSLRQTENRLTLPGKQIPEVPVTVSTIDFKATRTAMFGKTRLGKSNIVKIIAQSLIETTKNVGQLIFDINGEYANDNPQNPGLANAYPDKCEVYAITKKDSTKSHPLKLNFYEQPGSSKQVLSSLLQQDNQLGSNYIRSFDSVELPDIETIQKLSNGSEKTRAIRKIQMFWAILKKAGFAANDEKLKSIFKGEGGPARFDPKFSMKLRTQVYGENKPPVLKSLDDLVSELSTFAKYRRDKPDQPLITDSKNNLFDAEDNALLEFLEPQAGRSGVTILRSYLIYHDPNAGNFVEDILKHLDNSKTVILDLGNAHPRLLTYFSDLLSKAVFSHQVNKFSNDKLDGHYFQIYFEEAHNLFPRNDDSTTIYSRFAKEGAKYHIGMVYSTQSPTTINRDLLAQTENFFILHLSSRDDVNALAKVNVVYESLREDILRAKTRGYVRMLTRSHRFVVSAQAIQFTPSNKNK